MNKNIWLSASHIAGVDDIEADFLSRVKHSDMEWILNKEVFNKIQAIYGVCDIDLFASKHNKQLPRYSSYMPDTHAHMIDAFSVTYEIIYCLPFQCNDSGISRNREGQIRSSINCSDMGNTDLVSQITTSHLPGFLHSSQKDDLIILPNNPTMRHPLEKMRLGVFCLSGNQLKVQQIPEDTLEIICASWKDSTKVQYRHDHKSGCNFVVKNKSIHLRQM